MSGSPTLRLDDQLCFALYTATNAVTRAYRPLLGELHLTYPQYLVMLALWQDGTISVGRVAERLRLGPNAVAPILDHLERAGFVERQRDGVDRRVVHVVLTEKGKALERAAAAAQYKVACRTGYTEVDYERLRQELMQLAERLAAAKHEEPPAKMA